MLQKLDKIEREIKRGVERKKRRTRYNHCHKGKDPWDFCDLWFQSPMHEIGLVKGHGCSDIDEVTQIHPDDDSVRLVSAHVSFCDMTYEIVVTYCFEDGEVVVV